MKTILVNSNAVFTKVSCPNTFRSRLVGLLNKSSLNEQEAMWFDDCSSIHMLGMKFSIDVIYLDSNNRIVKMVESLKPWRCSFSFNAKKVVEVKSGMCKKYKFSEGDQLVLVTGAENET